MQCLLLLLSWVRKREIQVLCKHIKFAFVCFLQFKDERLLSNTWVSYNCLKSVVSSAPFNISTLFNKAEVQNRTSLECQRNLQSAKKYGNKQSTILCNNRKDCQTATTINQRSMLKSYVERYNIWAYRLMSKLQSYKHFFDAPKNNVPWKCHHGYI